MITRLLFFLLPLSIFGQMQRVVYDVEYRLVPSEPEKENCQMVLDITETKVKFYDKALLRMDSINKNSNARNIYWGDIGTVVRERNSKKHLNYQLMDDYFVYPSNDPIDWKMTSETMKLDSHQLQKATCTFGGRNWEAWFCPEIPIHEGPYKFQGLPGLIFSVSDDQDQYRFSLVNLKEEEEVYPTDKIIETLAGERPIKISYKKYVDLKLEEYNDPLKDFRLSFDAKPNTKYYYNNQPITSKEQIHQYEKEAREWLFKENNPIELDKAIPYPNQ